MGSGIPGGGHLTCPNARLTDQSIGPSVSLTHPARTYTVAVMAGFRVGTVRTAGLIAALAAAALVSAAPASAALSYVESGGVSTTTGNRGFTKAECPLSSFAVGGGVFSTGGFGAVEIHASYPGEPATNWSEFTDVYAGTQTHRAFAICDSTQPTRRMEEKKLQAGSEKTVRAACPPSKHVYGGGFFSSGNLEDTIARSSRPYDGPDADKVRDDGWEATFFESGTPFAYIYAYALCGPKKTTVRTKTVDVNPTSQGFVQKKCGSGDQVTGGGAHIAVGNGKGWISSIYPADADSDGINDDIWAAYFENTSSRKREITVYAICR